MEQHEVEIESATCDCCRWTDGSDDCSLYNELVFSTEVLGSSTAHMLSIIEAVLFPEGRGDWVEDLAHKIHRALKQNGVDVPLVEYHALKKHSASKAFTLVQPRS